MRRGDPERGSHSTWLQGGVLEEGGSEWGPVEPIAMTTTTARVWTADFPQRDCGPLGAAAFPSTAVFFPSSVFWFLLTLW